MEAIMRGCGLAALIAIGIIVIWAAAYLIGTATSGTTMVLALIAAGIITAFAAPAFLRALRECTRRRS
jgi:hypothetical protein